MKNTYKFILLFFALFAIVIVNSCDLEDANINPNYPTEVPARVLLPFNEERLANMMAGTGQVMTGIFMQYYQGVDNHPQQVQLYILNEALYVDWNWTDYYNGPMINLKKMIQVAEESNEYHYVGIGKVLMALCLGNISSLWGDVPYSEALNGSLNRSPKFDSQQSIYETIQILLDEGISNLNQTYSGQKPTKDDIFFEGNTEKWIKVAYALKARYYLHLSKKESVLGYNPAQNALDAVTNGISSSLEDLSFPYGYSASEYNPFYSFARLNYLKPNPSFTTLLSAISDPRRNFYYKKKFGEATLEDSYCTSNNSRVNMMTYYELKFIEAEARLRLNEADPLAQAALQEAVRANLIKVSNGTLDNTTIDNYINANAVLSGDFNSKLSTIIRQKYIALFASIESWTDYRRTGYPELIPNEGGDHNQNPGGAIPRRLAYPQSERLLNKNFPAILPTLQDRFWWDQD